MPTRTPPTFRFRYCPPFDWHGPRPIVTAFRAKEMTTISDGGRAVSLDVGEWLVTSSDGGMVAMGHEIFRRWYDPMDARSAAAITGQKLPRRAKKPRRRRTNDRQLEAPISARRAPHSRVAS